MSKELIERVRLFIGEGIGNEIVSRIEELEQERDQLREQVTLLRDALDYVIRDLKLRADMKEDDEHGIVDIGDGALIQAEEALTATEPK